jgi:diguanylate cyclase (GGDEF)-like protein
MSSALHPSPAEAGPPPSVRSPELSQLGTFVRSLTVVLFGMVALGEVVAFLTGSLQIAMLGIPVASLGLWLLWAWPRVTPAGLSRFVIQLAIGYFVLVLLVATMLPPLASAITLAGLLPVAIGLPYLTGLWLKRLMVTAWTLSVFLGLAAETVADTSVIPDWAIGILKIFAGSALAALLLFLLWQYRNRLTESARQLGGLVELSRDLADTMDPHLVGERMARHLAEVSGASRCLISSWDRTGDAVLTYAAYPPDLAGKLEPEYRLAEYPVTRRVLETKQPVSIHVDDPDADPHEVALLRDQDQTALVLLPLVAKGETIGLIELSRMGRAFGERETMLAFTFASEAAMALENARLYQQLHHQAFHDPLTRLANRSLFTDRLGHALARGQRRRSQLAVLFIDVDDLKTVNDRLGHATGDAVLVAFADRLQLSLRDGDTAARIGGDEFAVLLEDLTDTEEAEAVARRILDVMSQPIPLNGSLITSGVSIGICTTASGMETADAVMRNADYAMYQAKLLGRGRVEVFRPSMREDASERQTLETLLHGAVERNELRVQYQPLVAMGTGRIAGMEALVRWDSPERGTLMPGDFIALAEETGLIVPIGRWVLEEACRQTREWQLLIGRNDLGISVNLSGRQFQHPALLSDILAALASTGLDASSLVVEITESILMLHTPSTMATLEALRKAGVRVAVDDFGTGYSSLAYLQRFPIDILKVDRTFVEHAADGGDGAVLARVIIELARALRLRVVAEGIEEFEQLQALLSFGCGHGQGYLLSRPVDAAEMETMLTNRPRPWDHLWARIREASPRIPSAS